MRIKNGSVARRQSNAKRVDVATPGSLWPFCSSPVRANPILTAKINCRQMGSKITAGFLVVVQRETAIQAAARLGNSSIANRICCQGQQHDRRRAIAVAAPREQVFGCRQSAIVILPAFRSLFRPSASCPNVGGSVVIVYGQCHSQPVDDVCIWRFQIMSGLVEKHLVSARHNRRQCKFWSSGTAGGMTLAGQTVLPWPPIRV